MKKKLLCCLSLLMLVLASAVVQADTLPFVTDLVLRYEADSLNLANGAAVNSWPDSDPQNSNATLVSESPFLVPTYVTNALNGHSAVNFVAGATANPATQTMLTTAVDAVAAIGPSTTFFIVATGGPADRSQRILEVGRTRSRANNAKSLIADLSAGTSGNFFNNGYGQVTPSPFSADQWIVTMHTAITAANPSASIYQVNNVTQTFTATSNPNTYGPYTTGNEAMMGSITDKNGLWQPGYNGNIAEVLVYKRDLLPSDRTLVYNHLYNKYFASGAHNPTPAPNAANIGTVSGSNLNVTFSWTTGTDPNIAGHFIYISPNDPTFTGVVPTSIALGTPTLATTVPFDSTVYWRVDESRTWHGAPTSPTDPNTFRGPVWKFDSLKSTPVVTVDPVDTSVMAGGTATFTVTVTCPAAFTYQWYRSADNVADYEPTDVQVGTNSATLNVPNAQAIDQGYYYCKAYTVGGSDTSGLAKLGVKRLVAHYELDSNDLVAGKYIDNSGNGHDVDPNLVDPSAYLTTGIKGQALNTTVDADAPKAAGRTLPWAPAFGTGEVTISAWLNWAGLTGAEFWQGVVTSRGTSSNFLMEIRPSEQIQLNSQGDDELRYTLPKNTWVHVAITASATEQRMYFDGELVATNTAPDYAFPQYEEQLTVGCLNYTAPAVGATNDGSPTWPYNGLLDDVKIFNYALTQLEVIDIYDEFGTNQICLRADKVAELEFDVSGAAGTPDCKINLYDFAALAASWMNCGFYPQDACL